jgi:hypothetical protein
MEQQFGRMNMNDNRNELFSNGDYVPDISSIINSSIQEPLREQRLYMNPPPQIPQSHTYKYENLVQNSSSIYQPSQIHQVSEYQQNPPPSQQSWNVNTHMSSLPVS